MEIELRQLSYALTELMYGLVLLTVHARLHVHNVEALLVALYVVQQYTPLQGQGARDAFPLLWAVQEYTTSLLLRLHEACNLASLGAAHSESRSDCLKPSSRACSPLASSSIVVVFDMPSFPRAFLTLLQFPFC